MKNIKNHVHLVGRLGANPQVKELGNGNKMARFPFAVIQTHTSREGKKVTNVQWHSILAWGPVASIAEMILEKGTHVSLEGKLITRTYTNKDGFKKTRTEIVANELFVMNKTVGVA